MRSRVAFVVSLPERLARSLAAAFGGAVHETASLLLPRFVRRSRFYEATAKNLLRITIELIGGVEPLSTSADELEPDAGRLAVRKGVGNAVELGSIAAFGFSPLWVLAAASDGAHGSRVYLDAFVSELKAAGVLGADAELESVDDLLSALEGTTGTTARLIDVPPLEVAALRRSFDEIRHDASELPSPAELARAYADLRQTARREGRSLLEISVGVGLAFASSARNVGREHVLVPYAADLKPVRDEGFGAYTARVLRRYADAVSRHLDPGRTTLTERSLERLHR